MQLVTNQMSYEQITTTWQWMSRWQAKKCTKTIQIACSDLVGTAYQHTHTHTCIYLTATIYIYICVFVEIYLCMPASLQLIECDFRGHTLINIAIDWWHKRLLLLLYTIFVFVFGYCSLCATAVRWTDCLPVSLAGNMPSSSARRNNWWHAHVARFCCQSQCRQLCA